MASGFDVEQTAASVYADSLLEVANEHGQAESISEELGGLRQLWDADPDFAAMMRSAAIDDDARSESLKRIFQDKVSAYVLNMLLVLNDHRRSMILPLVCEAFQRKLEQQLGQEQVFVTTAVEMNGSQRDRLQKEIKRLIGREPVLVERVNDAILGGVHIQAADRVYDLTVRTRLREMRKNLLQSVEHHMRGGTSRFVTEG